MQCVYNCITITVYDITWNYVEELKTLETEAESTVNRSIYRYQQYSSRGIDTVSIISFSIFNDMYRRYC